VVSDATLDALYQEVILDHNRRPRNFHPMPAPSCSADGKNPNCGDQLTIWVRVEGGRVTELSFQGVGCAISKASASLLTEALKGKTSAEALALYDTMHRVLTGTETDAAVLKGLGPLRALSGVSKFPMRVKCASLAWHAFKAALDGAGTVSTESVAPAPVA